MAEGKKSVVLYTDLYHTVKELTDEEAGRLFKHYLAYINDLNPEAPDRLTAITFEPIKQQLKRDLVKWSATSENKSNGGKLGNLKRWNPDLFDKVLSNEITIEIAESIAHDRRVSHTDKNNRTPSERIASVPVNDNVNVNDTVIKDIEGGKPPTSKNKKFIPPEFPEFEEYCKKNGFGGLAQKAFDYYEAGDWKDSKDNPVKNWKQKLQGVWFREENLKFNNTNGNGSNQKSGIVSTPSTRPVSTGKPFKSG